MPALGYFVPVEHLELARFKIPTDSREADGTLEWHHTKLLVVFAFAVREPGLGYTYAGKAAEILREELQEVVTSHNAMGPTAAHIIWERVRNMRWQGICSLATSALDCALWDLKARLLGLPLVTLPGQMQERAPVCGSSGFTSYSDQQAADQLAGWAREEIGGVKVKKRAGSKWLFPAGAFVAAGRSMITGFWIQPSSICAGPCTPYEMSSARTFRSSVWSQVVSRCFAMKCPVSFLTPRTQSECRRTAITGPSSSRSMTFRRRV